MLGLKAAQAVSPSRGTETPLAFQSALAGVLLAAEMVLDARGLRPNGFPVRTSLDVLRPVPGEISFHHRKAPGRNCICQDDDFVRRYISKWA